LGPINPAPADGALVGPPLPANVLPVALEAPGICIGGFIGPGICFTSTYNAAYAGPAPSLIAGTSQINFNTSDAVDVFAPGLYLQIQTPAGWVNSNSFAIHLENQ
jgi:hypothetical protein